METLGSFERTGRVTKGPGSDLVELVDDGGLRHTAVVFHDVYRGHPAIGPALDVIVGFLEAPYVTGLVELVDRPEEGAFVYPTGEAVSVYELVRGLADAGETGGVRAGLEILYAAGEILVEAAEAGEPHGVYSHGGVTPWRVLIKPDGQVEVIGHALPQVEILHLQDHPDDVPREDSFRYCPPERLEGSSEDLSADLFTLALVAFEVMTGRPVYDGLDDEIRTRASRGETSQRLFRFKDKLPQPVRDLLRLTLKPTPEDRFESGEAFLEAVKTTLGHDDVSGEALVDVVAVVRGQQRRDGEALQAGATMALDKGAREKILAELEAEDAAQAAAAPEAAPEEGSEDDSRWSKPDPGRRARRARKVDLPGRRRSTRSAASSKAPEAKAPEAALQPVEPKPAPPAEDQGNKTTVMPRVSADDLLKRIRTSTETGAFRRRQHAEAASEGRLSADQVMDKLLSSSSSSSRRRSKASGDTPRKARKPREKGSSAAEALLARAKAKARKVADAAESEAPEAAPPEPSPVAATAVPAPVAAVAPAPEPGPESKPAPAAAPPPAVDDSPRSMKVRKPGGGAAKIRLRGDLLLADAARSMAANVAPLQLSSDGRVVGAWRLGDASGPLPGTTRIGELEADELRLHAVPLQMVRLTVQIGDHTVATVAASTVGVGVVADEVAGWIGGDSGALSQGGVSVPASLLVAELDPSKPVTVG